MVCHANDPVLIDMAASNPSFQADQPPSSPDLTSKALAPPVAPAIIEWQRREGRHHLPWQATRDPYRVWLSEIMLQQTQVATVISYYERFTSRFPDVASLANASLDEVLALWAGLGYYRRARNLHACARHVMDIWGGTFPPDSASLETLPGIGRSTAAAIAAFCYGERSAILDGNVRRVFCRYFGIEGDPGSTDVLRQLWALAQDALPTPDQIKAQPDSMVRYTQGLMDLGATRCTRSRPACTTCPLQALCIAHKTHRTHLLPSPRARKARSEQDVHLLFLTCAGRVFMCKRPDEGVWANLWSVPQAGTEKDLRSNCASLIDLTAAVLEPMATFTHDLTHFRMVIQPWRLALPDTYSETFSSKSYAPLEQGVWIDQQQLESYGMPAPIRPLIEMLTQPPA